MLSPAATWPSAPRSVSGRPFSSEADQIATPPPGGAQRGPPAARVTESSRASGSTGGSSSSGHTPSRLLRYGAAPPGTRDHNMISSPRAAQVEELLQGDASTSSA